MFPMMPPQGNKQERGLLKTFKSLNEENKETLIAFADFLQSRNAELSQSEDDVDKPIIPTEPLDIPRPDDESVIKAIKRLTSTYPMIDKEKILNPISSVMTSHIMQGKSSNEAIDELESLFLNEYKSEDKTDSTDD